MTYEVHLEWGIRRPDGRVAPMISEEVARGFAAGRTEHGFTLQARVVAHIPWTADLDAALAEADQLRAVVNRDPGPRRYDQLTEQEGGPPNERATERTCIDPA